MMIKNITVYGIRLPLKQPFKIAYDVYDDMPSILVRVESRKGIIGWGESVVDQHVSGETWQAARNIIVNELSPLVVGKSVDSIATFHSNAARKIRGNPSAKAALDIALHDLLARHCKVPLYSLLGGKFHANLDVPCVVSMLEPEEMARQAHEACQRGHRSVKIKLGGDVARDVERIARVREALTSSCKLRVDANQGWTLKQALQVIKSAEPYGVEWFEQPVSIDNLDALARTTAATEALIMADEPIQGVADMMLVAERRLADMVNIKLMKSGGLYKARTMAELGMSADIPCQVGSMVESSVATLAGAHLAISQRSIVANDLVGPHMLANDVAEVFDDPTTITLGEAPGLGVDIDKDRVQELSEFIDHID